VSLGFPPGASPPLLILEEEAQGFDLNPKLIGAFPLLLESSFISFFYKRLHCFRNAGFGVACAPEKPDGFTEAPERAPSLGER
jgi:hypothetical protein